VYTGLSTRAGGPGMATNSTVTDMLESVPEEIRPEFHGCCGEINALSKALNAGSDVSGATMSSVRAAGGGAGKVMTPCPTCSYVTDKLGVKVLTPSPGG
jgi:hypothetical protein